jgi:hypothetical protein
MPDLSERILDHVVPARIRRRWVTTVGWRYAGSLAACLIAATALFSQPEAGAWLTAISGEVSRRLLHATVFTLELLSFAVLSLANGWGILAMIGNCLAPIGRALTTLLSNPLVLTAFGAAAASCTALLWWMRPREKNARGIRNVGVLGF